MLEVSLDKSVGNFELQASFLNEKGVLGILGSSGSGKSLTLKCISGLYTPDHGIIKLNGKELFNSYSRINILPRNRKIGYVFQNYALFPHLTVYKNIAYGINNLDETTRHEKVLEMLAKMQLSGYDKRYPSQLSGGQQQRVALARTLITEPDLLLLDEPFSAIDNHLKYMLEKELLNIIKRNYEGIVVNVTHNIEEAYRLCDKILILDNGKVAQIGKKEEVVRNPATIAAARITGCKNIFEVEIVADDDEYIFIKYNNSILRVVKTMPILNTKMIAGIRAHDLRISDELNADTNTFECDIVDKIEGIFSTTVYVNCIGRIFRVEVSKYESSHLIAIKSHNLRLYIPAESIFLVNIEGDMVT